VNASISLITMGLSRQGIDALATLGVTASYRVIAAKRSTICINLSKYCTPILYYSSTRFNIYNPEFINTNIIISKLHTGYMQAFSTSYTDRKKM
ncbi:13971_t:CDS:2, partial [Cetraspora pellucida]